MSNESDPKLLNDVEVHHEFRHITVIQNEPMKSCDLMKYLLNVRKFTIGSQT
jgi:hypothetical protein